MAKVKRKKKLIDLKTNRNNYCVMNVFIYIRSKNKCFIVVAKDVNKEEIFNLIK